MSHAAGSGRDYLPHSYGLRRWLLNLLALVAVLAGAAAPMLQSSFLQDLHPAAANRPAGNAAVLVAARAKPTPTATPVATTAATGTDVMTVAAVPVRQNLVVLGDSVASGDACDCGGFGAYLARANGPAALTNAAQNGLTSNGLLAQLDSPALDTALAAATVVTVTIGANDFDESQASSCSAAACYAGTLKTMTSTISQITSRISALTRPGTTVVLTGYWNVFLDGAVGARNGPNYVATSDTLSRQVNAAIAGIAAQHQVLYADIYTPFKGDGSRDDTALLAADGDHPNAAGHRLIAAAIASAANLVSV